MAKCSLAICKFAKKYLQIWYSPNRNFYVKSIWCPTRPLKVRSQNQGYAQYLIKIKRKIRNFPKTWPKSLKCLMKIVFIEHLCFSKTQNSKTVPKLGLNTTGSQAIWIWEMMYRQNSGIFCISLILTSDYGWPCRASYWLYRKFLLGKKIIHVWEEKESLITSIWWDLVPVTC